MPHGISFIAGFYIETRWNCIRWSAGQSKFQPDMFDTVTVSYVPQKCNVRPSVFVKCTYNSKFISLEMHSVAQTYCISLYTVNKTFSDCQMSCFFENHTPLTTRYFLCFPRSILFCHRGLSSKPCIFRWFCDEFLSWHYFATVDS